MPRARPLLAAALIVRDEAGVLGDCLAGLRDLVDEVVIYDTGSTDGTPELAGSTGARVLRGYWDGDFARARNLAIDATSAPWVLIVDADERPSCDPDRLRAVLEAGLRPDAGVDGLVVPLVNVGQDGGELYAAPQVRIFRTDRAHYVGRLHERVEPRRPDGAPLRLAEQPRAVVQVRHLGYVDPVVVRAKAQRNLDLARRELERLQADPAVTAHELARALYHRGRTLLSAGQVLPALADLEQLRALDTDAAERTWGCDVLVQLLLGLGRVEQIPVVVEELRAAGVDSRYCSWLLARCLLLQERFTEALPLLRGVDLLVDAVGRVHDLVPVIEAQLIAAGRGGEVDEAAACCIRLMAGYGRTEGLGSLLLTLWGGRPVEWLVDLLNGADAGHLPAVVAELRSCEDPGPQLADALAAL